MVSYSLLEPNCGSSNGGAKSAGVLRAASIRVKARAVSTQVSGSGSCVLQGQSRKKARQGLLLTVVWSLLALLPERSSPRSKARYFRLIRLSNPARC